MSSDLSLGSVKRTSTGTPVYKRILRYDLGKHCVLDHCLIRSFKIGYPLSFLLKLDLYKFR